jgi:transcriptional regulator NrdR family protein
MTIFCPKCQNPSAVRDSRPIGRTTRRRRECKNCRFRWSTFEISAEYMKAIRAITCHAKQMISSAEGLLEDLQKIGDTCDEP